MQCESAAAGDIFTRLLLPWNIAASDEARQAAVVVSASINDQST